MRGDRMTDLGKQRAAPRPPTAPPAVGREQALPQVRVQPASDPPAAVPPWQRLRARHDSPPGAMGRLTRAVEVGWGSARHNPPPLTSGGDLRKVERDKDLRRDGPCFESSGSRAAIAR